MTKIVYNKNGITVDGEFTSLSDIIFKCNNTKVKEDKLLLLKMEWKGWRGFDEGIKEEIILPIEKIEIIKKYILGKEIYFGEIAGKHSEIYNTLDENDIEIISDVDVITTFLYRYPSCHEYNHSFLHTFHDQANDGVYDDISEDDIKIFATIFE